MKHRQPIQVLVYPVRWTSEGWRYLLLHRVPERGGFWQGVSGGVEWGETLLAAARRELVEETRSHPIELHPVDCSYSFAVQEEWVQWYAPGTSEITEHVFLALVEGEGPTIHPEEHDDWRWCAYQEALALLARPGNVEALKSCQRVLEQARHTSSE